MVVLAVRTTSTNWVRHARVAQKLGLEGFEAWGSISHLRNAREQLKRVFDTFFKMRDHNIFVWCVNKS